MTVGLFAAFATGILVGGFLMLLVLGLCVVADQADRNAGYK